MNLRYPRFLIALPCAVLSLAQAQPVAPPPDAGYVLSDGSVQIVCFDDMAGIVDRLDALFVRAHPGVKFTVRPADNLAALQSLAFDSTALAPVGTDVLGGASVAYAAIVHGEAFPVRIAHASLTPSAKMGPLAVIAHKSNPVEQLSVDQVARIFTETTRKPSLTHWSQVGVAGALAEREIHPCGLPWSDHIPSEDSTFADFMFLRKLGGGPPAPNYDMEPGYAEVVKKVGSDPQALGLTALNRVTPDVKVVGLVSSPWTGPSRGTAADLTAGRYAFDRYLYLFVRRVPGKPFDPFVKEYVRIALSPEGQRAVATEPHGYLALNPVEVGEEGGKLE